MIESNSLNNEKIKEFIKIKTELYNKLQNEDNLENILKIQELIIKDENYIKNYKILIEEKDTNPNEQSKYIYLIFKSKNFSS